MTKKYIYLVVLILSTMLVTLFLSYLYKKETNVEFSYAYSTLNRITASEFDEYILENPDSIIYISDSSDLSNNKFEKKFIKKIEKKNLMENIVYIEESEVTNSLQKKLEDKYSYKYNKKALPVILVFVDAELIEISTIEVDSSVDSIIEYEVFEW